MTNEYAQETSGRRISADIQRTLSNSEDTESADTIEPTDHSPKFQARMPQPLIQQEPRTQPTEQPKGKNQFDQRSHLQGKIEGHGRVIPQDAAPIPSPQGKEPFFLNSPNNTIKHPFELPPPASQDREVTLLRLQQQLRSLNRRDYRVHHPAHHRPRQ